MACQDNSLRGGEQLTDEQVQIVEYKPQRVVVSVRASEPGYLLLSDSWYPGWIARVDGVETPIQRGDYIFRAVQVSAGTHKIEFEYQPTSLYIGGLISVLAALILFSIVVIGLKMPVRKMDFESPEQVNKFVDGVIQKINQAGLKDAAKILEDPRDHRAPRATSGW